MYRLCILVISNAIVKQWNDVQSLFTGQTLMREWKGNGRLALFEDCTDAKFSMFILENLHSLAIICVIHQDDVT